MTILGLVMSLQLKLRLNVTLLICLYLFLILIIIPESNQVPDPKGSPCKCDAKQYPCQFSLKCVDATTYEPCKGKNTGICECEKGPQYWNSKHKMCLLKEGDFCHRSRLCYNGTCQHNNCYQRKLPKPDDPSLWYWIFIVYHVVIITAWCLCRCLMWWKRRNYEKPPRQGYFEYEMRNLNTDYRTSLLQDEELYGIQYDLPDELRNPPPPPKLDWF